MMKRWALAAACFAVFIAATASAGEFTLQKEVGDYQVDIKMDKNPPAVGMNHVEVAIKDKAGKAVKNAKVLVVASMPTMKGMKPVSNSTEAKLSADKYVAMIEIPQAGAWDMSVGIGGLSGKTAPIQWSIDAR